MAGKQTGSKFKGKLSYKSAFVTLSPFTLNSFLLNKKVTLMGEVLVKPQSFAVKKTTVFANPLESDAWFLALYGEVDVRFCIFSCKMKLDLFFPKNLCRLVFFDPPLRAMRQHIWVSMWFPVLIQIEEGNYPQNCLWQDCKILPY